MSTEQIAQPNLASVLQILKNNIFRNLNCARIGIIEKFNPITQTASVQLVDKIVFETFDGSQASSVNFTLLNDCPVFIPYGVNGGLETPISRGDECLVIINDRDIDNWFASGQIASPASTRMHDFSDAIAFVGLHSLAKSLPNYNNNATTIRYQNAQIQLTDKINIQNAQQNLKSILVNLVNTLSNAKVLNPNSGQYDLPFDSNTMSNLSNIVQNLNALLI